VPGYDVSCACNCSPATTSTSRLAAAKDALVQIGNRRDLVLPANDTLFTSGTLGRYSAMLTDLQQNEARAASPTSPRPAATRLQRELLEPNR
jgi:hypothetical protein